MISNLDLTKLGFTTGESKAYVALSELGPSTVGPIVKRSGIAYANVYDVLRRLAEKGMITYTTRGRTKIFQAAPPGELKQILKRKEEELNEQKDFVKKITPHLNELQKQYDPENAEVFIGFRGLRTAYKKMLSESGKNEELLSTYIHDKHYSEAADQFYSELIQEYPKRKFRVIANGAFRKSNYAKVAHHPMRYTSIPIFSHGEVIGSFLLLVSWQKPIMATLITAKNLADNFRSYFENIWKLAKK
jgi:sugar-specific transcriptional regulator TrmB